MIVRIAKIAIRRHLHLKGYFCFCAGFPSVLNRAQKEEDCKLAAQVACHSSTRTVDHLSEVLQDVGKGANLRTCGYIARNAPK